MEFVHPEILWGLSALAIPIVIHLLHFRRFRRVAFSQVAFLNEVQKDTRATQKIRHWWVLIARLLAFASVIIAFAQPQIPPTSTSDDESLAENGNAIALYIDNSHSMEAQGEEGQLLQIARNKARIVAEQFDPTDRFQVLTCDFSGRDQKFLTQEQALERIENIQTSAQSRSVSDVFSRVSNQLNKAPDANRKAYLFTDLQKSTHDLGSEPSAPDSMITWHFIPELAGTAPNIWVDSVWFEEPMRIAERAAALRIRIQHNSRNAVNGVPMNLSINGDRVAIGTFNLVPGLDTDTVLRFTHGAPGLKAAAVSIEDAPIRFDDAWNFGYEVTDNIRIALLTETIDGPIAQSVERVYQTAEGLFTLKVQSNWTPNLIAESHLLLLSQWPAQGTGFAREISDFVKQGGSIAILPDPETEEDPDLLQALQIPSSRGWQATTDRVRSISLEHPFFQGMFAEFPKRIDLPTVTNILKRIPSAAEEILAATGLEKPFLTRLPLEQGQVFVFHASPDAASSNLTQHALWIPLLLRMAERSYATPIHAGEIGSIRRWSIAADFPDASSLRLTSETKNTMKSGTESNAQQANQNGVEWFPEVRRAPGQVQVLLEGMPFSPGHYFLGTPEKSGAVIGLNQDRRESNHTAFKSTEFLEKIEELGWRNVKISNVTSSSLPQIIEQSAQGVPLWKAFLIFALIALGIETLLLRTWKA